MRRLTLLLDARCPGCRRFRTWIAGQPTWLPLDVVIWRSEAAQRRFPSLQPRGPDLASPVVVNDIGQLWRGAKVWRMCLWALVWHRETSLSERLSREAGWDHDHPAAEPPGGAGGGPGARPPVAWASLAESPLRGNTVAPPCLLSIVGGVLLWTLLIPFVLVAGCALTNASVSLTPNVLPWFLGGLALVSLLVLLRPRRDRC